MNKFSKIILYFIAVLIFSNRIFAATNINFSTNIASEFPAGKYNQFVSLLQNDFNDYCRYDEAMYANLVPFSTGGILDETKKFTFGGSLYWPSNISAYENGRFKKTTYDDYHDGPRGFNVFISIKFVKKLDFFINANLWDLRFGFTLLWKFFENEGSRENDYSSVHSKLFLASNFMFQRYKRDGLSSYQEPYYVEYDIEDGSGLMKFNKGGLIYIRGFNTSIDFTLKYIFKYRWFNLHAAAGATFHIASIHSKYQINVNVDYYGSGSPTGEDTVLNVEFKKTWLIVMPHISAGLSFNIAKWMIFPSFMFNLVYNTEMKKFIYGITFMGMMLRF